MEYQETDAALHTGSPVKYLTSIVWSEESHPLVSIVTRPECIRASLGCGGRKDLQYGRAADKSDATSDAIM